MDETTNNRIAGIKELNPNISQEGVDSILNAFPASKNQTITSESLNKETPFAIASGTQPNLSIPELGYSPSTTEKPTAGQNQLPSLSELQKSKDTSKTEYETALLELGKQPQKQEAIFEQLGGIEAKQKADEYQSQLESEQLSLRRSIERIRENPDGLSVGALNAKINDLERNSLSKQADVAILYNSELRKYDTASTIAERKVAVETEYLKAQLEVRKNTYEENKDRFTQAEQRQIEKVIREEERAYQEIVETKKTVNNLAIEARKNGAPTSIVNKILQSGNAEDAIRNLGGYAMSAVDNALKVAQTAKIYADIKSSSGNANNSPIAIEKNLDKINSVKGIISNKKGLEASSGNLQRKAGFSTSIKDWRADAVNVLKTLTVDELGRVKSDGVTFGALSDSERKAIGDSASALISGSKTRDGEITGYFNLSEKKVTEEFEKIQKYLELDFEKRTGVPYTTYVANSKLDEKEYANALINNNPYSVLAE